MKICVINPNYYRSSGVTTAIRRIYEGVTPLGIDQYFVDCEYGKQEDTIEWVAPGRITRFRLMTQNPIELLIEMTRFLRWLKTHGISIVHVHHRRLASLLRIVQSASTFQLVYTGQVTYPFAWWFWMLSPKIVVAISLSVAENLQSTTRHKLLEVIPNASNFPSECPGICVEDVKNTVVCIARLEPVKGHENLIRAWKVLLERGYNANLRLVGEGSSKDHLQSLSAELGLKDRVDFCGFRKDIASEINRCMFAVLASKVEGHPLAVLEAASYGRPTLLTNVDGSRDCIPPQISLVNGVEYGNITQLADALEVWLSDPDKVVQDGRTFYTFLKAESSTEAVAMKYYQFYNRVLSGGNAVDSHEVSQ